jgi:molecular chaperone GrpE
MSKNDEEKNGEEIEYITEKPDTSDKTGKKEAAPGEPAVVETVKENHKPESEEGGSLKTKLKKREAEIKLLKKEKEELRDRFLRNVAEMENTKKRMEREKANYIQYSLSEILLELLTVLDNFERALSTAEQTADGKTFREGIDLIFRMYQNILFKEGVQPIEIKDGVFDPNIHHAVDTKVSDEVKGPVVAEVLQKGYMLRNRLLRPSLVRVLIPRKD